MEKYGPIELPIKVIDTTTIWFDTYLYVLEDNHYHVLLNNQEHPSSIQYLRIESACTFAHLYGSRLCDCEDQLRAAFQVIGRYGGVFIYALEQHGRGIGLVNHFRAYELEQTGLDTVSSYMALGHEIDARNYTHIVEILKDLGIDKVNLLSNNPNRIDFLQSNLEYVKRIPLQPRIDGYNVTELTVKKEKMGHLLTLKSDSDWFEYISGRDTLGESFHVVRRAKELICSGDIERVTKVFNQVPYGKEEFYTVYFDGSGKTPNEILRLVKMLRAANTHQVILRIVLYRVRLSNVIRGLNRLVDRRRLYEIKPLVN